MGLTIGSDPEFMIGLLDKTGKKIDLKSAIRALKGHGKENKIAVSEGQNAFYDNVLMEFNIAPAHSFGEFSTNWLICMDFAEKILTEEGLTLIRQASADFPLEEVSDEEASHFGCEPEYCIYLKDDDNNFRQVTPPTVLPGNGFRSCGGHIHIGHPIAIEEPARLVKFMDGFVGATATLLDHDPTSAKRRQLYGGAGTHRRADYGLEYRTLSNFWYASPTIARIIWRLTRFAVQACIAFPGLIDEVVNPAELQTIINEGKEDQAAVVANALARYLPADLVEDMRAWRQNKGAVGRMQDEWNLLKLAA